jgi:hypothetical protein
MAVVSEIAMSNFLKVYGGEVVTAYNADTMLAGLLKKRVITSGKSASFPTLTRETSKLHVPGDDVFVDTGSGYASGVTSGEIIVTIEKAIIAPQFVDDMDATMADYNIHSELASQAGEALAFTHDAMLIGAVAGDAASANDVVVTGAYAAVTGTNLALGIRSAAQTMDEQYIPQKGRYCMLPPNEFYKLMDTDGVVSSDFNTTGDKGKLGTLWYMGFVILNSAVYAGFANKSVANQIASGGVFDLGGNYATVSNDDLSFNGLKLLGTCFHEGSAGSVILKGVSAEANYIPNRLGTLLNAKQGLGVGNLRPTSCVNLYSTT